MTPELADGELIDDRSVDALDADRFSHGDFVRELASMVQRTPTPANIALFGPWGSGKSGVANLLGMELPGDPKKARFVVFDASKYAEAPLRRHFISQVAHGLKNKDVAYHEGLYKAVEGRTVKFNPSEWAKLALAFLASAALTLGVLLLIATLVAALSAGPFRENWSPIVRDYLLATLPVAVIITTFVKLAADGFHVKTTRSAPSGDEEFEDRFKRLVASAKTERLVVFIDELDRCSPEQVASVLETLKTFLFVEGCVFVVAADQQVLEQALRRRVRQHTPEDASNPYYSAGSSYLDKVFQYQLTLPPLRSPTLSRFALALTEGRPGVWQRVPNPDEVVAVLIPTHVASPRRVKVLLNRFAIAYRLAERRAAAGQLDPDVGRRSTELAKLVCLQSEFPLFAQDLTFDARLPKFVRMVAEDEFLPENLPEEVAQRAHDYAKGRRVVAELLVDSDQGREPAPAGSMTDAEADRAEPPGEPDDDHDESVARSSDVARQHAEQLVSYLRKTRYVGEPGADLLYLESAGAVHGIDAVLADRLQRAGVDNDLPEVLNLVASAGDDGQRRGALLVLADVIRQARPGLEGRNVVSTLMQGIHRSGIELGEAADPLADAVAGHLAQADLQRGDLMGALDLAAASGRDVAESLLAAVLRHPERADAEIATALVRQADSVPDDLRSQLAEATRTAILRGEQAEIHLARVSSDRLPQLLADTARPLKEASDAHYAATAARDEGQEYDNDSILERSPSASLGAVLGASLPESRALGIELTKLTLKLDRRDYRNVVVEHLGELSPISDTDLVMAVLRATNRRQLGDWSNWLDPIDPEVVGCDQGLEEWVDSLASAWWDKFVNADDAPAAAEAKEAVEALGRCGERAGISNDIEQRVRKKLDEPLATSAVVEEQADAMRSADWLVEAGLLDAEAVAGVRLSGVAKTLQAGVTGVSEVSAAVLSRVAKAVEISSTQVLLDLLEAAKDSSWISEADRVRILLTTAAALLQRDPTTSTPVSPETLRELADSSPDSSSTDIALALWLDNFATEPRGVWRVLEPLVGAELPGAVGSALGRFAGRIANTERYALIESAIDRVQANPVDRSFLAAARLSEVPAHKVGDRLVALFDTADLGAGRRIMDIWQQLSPTGQTVQQRLVEGIFLPLIASGDEGLDMALSYFGLVATAKGVRKSVREALRSAAHSNDQRRRVDDRLHDAGWTKESLFGLGPAVDKEDE